MGFWTLTGKCINFVNVQFAIYFKNDTDISTSIL